MTESHNDTGNNLMPHHHHHASPIVEQDELDPGNQALADALRWLFVLLKVCITAVLILFLASGAYKVEQNQQAIVLRFGKVVGNSNQERIKQAGWHWAWPYIDKIIKIPAKSAEQVLDVDSFWFYMTETEKTTGKLNRPRPTLDFKREGYTLTASRGAEGSMGVQMGELTTDYNIAHTKWRIRYFIEDPIAFVEQLWDGTPEGWQSVKNLLRSTLSDAVITTSAHWDIDNMIWGDSRKLFLPEVQQEMVKRVDALEVGLRIQLDLVDIRVPRQVDVAFARATGALSEREQILTAAHAQAEEIVNSAKAQAEIIKAQANAYRVKLVEAAKADSQYLDDTLAQINRTAQERYPRDSIARRKMYDELLSITVDQLYQETLREVMANADEIMVLPTPGKIPMETRILISRDSMLAPKKQEKKEDKYQKIAKEQLYQ